MFEYYKVDYYEFSHFEHSLQLEQSKFSTFCRSTHWKAEIKPPLRRVVFRTLYFLFFSLFGDLRKDE